MAREVGLWVDCYKAVIVSIENEVEQIREVRSNVEKLAPTPGSKRPKASENSQKPEAKDTEKKQPGRYYEAIVSLIRDAKSIWIFGPGHAKDHLINRLKFENLDERIVGIETVKKMTDRQIVIKVQMYYLK